MDQEIRFLGDVQRLALRADDVVVLSVSENISDEIARCLRKTCVEVLGNDRKVLVLANGIRIGVMGAE